ncbi:putative receptor-like protein kinase At2g39360 [Bidens hawaiensis]|uniref:putative receptor-like protein kinase At2g39360 n=1 Tax=Bidens hawaiensis TaxID=980011 RepID=UPI00404A3165
MKFPLSHIKLATDDFSYAHLIESYRYDRLYKAELDHIYKESVLLIKGGNKGELLQNQVIIKRFDYKTMPKDFFAEIEMLSSFKHPNLVSLIGFCDEDSEMILVFECAFKETLNDYLRSESHRTNLTWEQQIHIGLDIAHGLKYLHNMACKPSMIHRVISSIDIFLDEKWTARIAGFRLSEFNSCPASWGQLGERLVVDDIYFLGVILFEILTGSPVNYNTPNYMDEDVNEFASMVR